MPFTIAHAAVAAPLWAASRRRLVLSALIVGSMVPDAEYFVHLRTKAEYGHSWFGIVWFGVPVSLALLWLWHRVVKQPMLMLIPPRWSHVAAAADREFRFLPLPRLALIIVSILIGAASHLVLDAFTHGGEWGVEAVPALQETWISFDRFSLTGYKVLQYGGGIGGMTFLGAWLLWWAARQPRDAVASVKPLSGTARFLALTGMATMTLLMGFLAATWRYNTPGLEQPLYGSFVSAVIGMVTGLCLASVTYALAMAILRPLESRL